MISDATYDKAQELIYKLRSKGLRVAFAESLTGGMVSAGLVDVSGASDVFDGAVVSYTDEVKINVLGVPHEIIDEYTACSPECAKAMAEGARRLIGSDIAVAVTGHAGVNEGSIYERSDDDGSVFFGYAVSGDSGSYYQFFEGDRFLVRLQTTLEAYDLVDRLIEEYE